MAKVSAVQRDLKRRKMVKSKAKKRAALKAIIKDKEVGMEDRFAAVLSLAELPKNSVPIRRRMASRGELPGVTKASW